MKRSYGQMNDIARTSNAQTTSNLFTSGALVPEDLPKPKTVKVDMTSAVFSDGRTSVKMSESHRSAHPAHFPTGTAEVLTFYPTMEEFKDFNGYIQKVERAGAHSRCGIAKIVPPDGWHPRPKKKNNYNNIDEFEINNPVKETIEGRSGVFTKSIRVYRKTMTVKEFRKMANSAQYKNPKPDLEGVDLENEYFKNILNREPIYGADTEGSIYEKGVNEFNMNNLNTILDETKSKAKVNGVNTVYLYFGMYKTTFPWHAEDMDLYSINYLHFGAPKYWFAISADSADRFERLMQQQFPEQFHHCRAFLRHKSFIVTPTFLRNHNIKYGTMMQRPNEFIITFPKGYHMGFNTGYNLAESTNFATDRWIDYGKNAHICKCTKDSVEIDMIPFMSKYRPDEFEHWHNYWYKEREINIGVPRSKKAKKGATGTVRKSRLSSDNCSVSSSPSKTKRARLGVEETMSGSVSESESTSSSTSAGSGNTVHAFAGRSGEKAMSRLGRTHDLESACERETDVEELKFRWKKLSKDLWSSSISLFSERQANELTGRQWPHCDVCSMFQPMHMRPKCCVVPKRSRRLIKTSHFSKQDTTGKLEKDEEDDDDELKREEDEEEDEMEEDELLMCDNCHVTVHSKCYSGESRKDGASWKCIRCRMNTDVEIRFVSCALCELRGGALIKCKIGSDEESFVHVSCALLNRRTVFDRAIGPTSCFVFPPPKHGFPEAPSSRLSFDYLMEFGVEYENSKWECNLCKKSREGLVTCTLCYDDLLSGRTMFPTQAHVTCARFVGFTFETREWPKCAVMVCDRHNEMGFNELLVDRSPTMAPIVRHGDPVWTNEDGELVKGRVESIVMKRMLVIDFLDSSVSRDTPPGDVISCECISCDGTEHQYGSRLKVKWDDGILYDGYFRGFSNMPEYKIRFDNGSYNNYIRSKISTKRELNSANLTP